MKIVGECEREGKGKEREEKDDEARMSQRQRRRVGSIKRQLLREASSNHSSVAEASTSVKHQMSRRQRRQQRLARLASRPSPSSTALTTPAQPKPSLNPPSQQPPQTDDNYPIEYTVSTSRSGRAADRPHLPHFNDRVQCSHWDDPLTKLHTLIDTPAAPLQTTTSQADAQQDHLDRAAANQALMYYEKAARSRGDHIIVRGVGKNGDLGPTVT